LLLGFSFDSRTSTSKVKEDFIAIPPFTYAYETWA
jgi:hypothetical protein